MKLIRTSFDFTEALAFKNFLEGHGIPSNLRNHVPGVAIIDPIEILVLNDADAEKAFALSEEWETRATQSPVLKNRAILLVYVPILIMTAILWIASHL